MAHRPSAASNALFAAVAGHLLLIGLLMLALPAPRPPTVHSDRVLQLIPLRAAPAVPEPAAARTPGPSAVIDRTAAPGAAAPGPTDTVRRSCGTPSSAQQAATKAASPALSGLSP